MLSCFKFVKSLIGSKQKKRPEGTRYIDQAGEWCEFTKGERMQANPLRPDDFHMYQLEIFKFSKHKYGISIEEDYVGELENRWHQCTFINLLTREVEDYESTDVQNYKHQDVVEWLSETEFCLIECEDSLLKQTIYSVDHLAKKVTRTSEPYEYPLTDPGHSLFRMMPGDFHYKGNCYTLVFKLFWKELKYICYLLPKDPRTNTRMLTIHFSINSKHLVNQNCNIARHVQSYIMCSSFLPSTPVTYSEARQGLLFEMTDKIDRFTFFSMRKLDFQDSDVLDIKLNAENLKFFTLQSDFQEVKYNSDEKQRLVEFTAITVRHKKEDVHDLYLLDFTAKHIHRVVNVKELRENQMHAVCGIPVELKNESSTTFKIRPFHTGRETLQDLCRMKILFGPNKLKIDPEFEKNIFK